MCARGEQRALRHVKKNMLLVGLLRYGAFWGSVGAQVTLLAAMETLAGGQRLLAGRSSMPGIAAAMWREYRTSSQILARVRMNRPAGFDPGANGLDFTQGP